MSKKQGVIEVEGLVLEALPGATFRVQLDKGEDIPEDLRGKDILGKISGKMLMHRIRIIPGDRVKMEMMPVYDKRRGRIVYRYK